MSEDDVTITLRIAHLVRQLLREIVAEDFDPRGCTIDVTIKVNKRKRPKCQPSK
jgi:hypothetical protein